MASGMQAESPGGIAARRRNLFGNPNFVVPYLAETQSIGGDQIGRVALAILVFDRTGSAAWTALTYALTYLPAILGGLLLGGIGDRLPQVWVMVLTDAARAALFLAVAIPGMPLEVMVALVAVAFFLGPAFTAAMVSRLAHALGADQFRAASGIRMISAQTVQVAGFAVGGVIVATISPRAALTVNAATFALSALLIGVSLSGRPRRPGRPTEGRSHVAPLPSPSKPRLWQDPWLRHLMLMTSLAAFFVVPEGLAVPLTHDLRAGETISGLLLAAGPLGSAVGAALLVAFVPRRRGMTVAALMAIGCGLPLLITALLPPWPVVAGCWALSGGLWAFQIDVATAFVHAVGEHVRARMIARASAVTLGAQGLGLIAFGAVGECLGARWGVALAGLAGVVAATITVCMAIRRGIGPYGTHARHRAGLTRDPLNRDALSGT